ncbi:hypothetical protein BABINDRAFT_5176 [Babjeviella inositovora NRRL Y-12698]|uniref:ABC transporter family G domain-containing protein n=1 Tax=Babjeviella inositovora NRRL Y-12698 TaxID=984486 RepID=A0A1E3QYH0_9ASCO|nr:uncharacterized protein BABINDRAFT_5176 [Babjeviella inositovora NRRL Y-12698]ODQ82172.1 hypothetical protein BABINDRAFT_5176 [Babjeviella inositovora NRRL Y-12698]
MAKPLLVSVKNLSIAIKLVFKSFLFLDEPTSGVGSQSALLIIRALRALSDSDQAILCTIHQQSTTLLEVFDRLMLKKGGRIVYLGDVDLNSEAISNYFERQFGIKCDVFENLVEHILNCISVGATARSELASDWEDF